MTNHQINYIIWIPLLVYSNGTGADHGSTLGTASLRVCTAFTIPSWQRAE
jgi:hypothetical protein